MQQSSKNPTAAIIGGGIGGLTAALTLAKRGFTIDVFEQAPEFQELGAGLQLSPNAVKILQSLGLGSALQTAGFRPDGIEIRHWKNGSTLASETLGDESEDRWGAPYYHIRRATLHRLLLEAAGTETGIRLHSNAGCVDITQVREAAQLRLETGTTHATGLLVGADGIHSTVREKLWGAENARFTGHVAWRLLIATESLPPDLIRPVASLWMGPGAHFVHYYVDDGRYINCVCVVEQNNWQHESWTEPGDRAELLAAFEGWHESLQALIEAADPASCHRWALYDRDPLPQWGQGCITLLGDACHPTLPFLAQGAAMAIEDAAVLADCLKDYESVAPALQRYEQLRGPRTARVQLTSRRNGRIYHMKGPMARARNLALRSGLASTRRTTDWLYHYDARQAAATTAP